MKRIILICMAAVMGLQAVCCGALRADINRDGRVDIADLAILASEWLMEEPYMELGLNLITNGEFEDDTVWGFGIPCWSWFGAGKFAEYSYDSGITPVSLIQTLPTLTAGKLYRVTFKMFSPPQNTMWVVLGGTSVQVSSPDKVVQINETMFIDIIAGSSDQYLRFSALYDYATIDNVSVCEVFLSANKNNSFGPWRFGCE